MLAQYHRYDWPIFKRYTWPGITDIYSFGAFTRDVQYLVKRIAVVNRVNKGCFNEIGLNSLPKNNTGEDLFVWFDWLKTDSVNKFKAFDSISGLLAQEYANTIKPVVDGKLSSIRDRIKSSRESIEYQLQRIYLHRNQIVHSGDYINEYTNLWIHLEWYIGKFLYCAILNTQLTDSSPSIDSFFRDLESDFEYASSYIEKNPSKLCRDSDKIFKLLLRIDWQ